MFRAPRKLGLVASLVITGVFLAFLSIPGGIDEATPSPEIAFPTLLPTSSNTPIGRSSLQAAAYTNFVRLFGTTEPRTPLVPPVAQFHERIVKKPFGIFITPDTSPVEGDRFFGYHTGVDAEFTDTAAEVPVYAITDGTIAFRGWVNGYGGLVVLRHVIDGVSVYALYGHLDPASLPAADITSVNAGEQIALLGDDHSQETDGVRKHIHFSILTGDTLDMHGYVKTEAELAPWLNPLDFYPQ